MTDTIDRLLEAFELHDPAAIAALVAGGLDVHSPIRGKNAATWLTEMYARSPRFPACLRALLDGGARLDDPALTPVLLDDAQALAAALREDPALLQYRTSLSSAFTPLQGATLLHVAAEFQCAAAMDELLRAGADPNACAGVDENGLGGHTPLFHTVNANDDRAAACRHLLLAAGARADVRIAGLVWGRGFEWETTFFDLTPISYAQLGLLPQVHRDERQIRATIDEMLRAAGRPVPPVVNVPNRYLARGRSGS
ncbi:MAG: ankyrin repeat domain-containing protein [Planctomycetes bacterium]|nr:ankyrin repeat domain-containing protein [Planctomycetota bacterium]